MKKKLKITGSLNDAVQTNVYSQFEADPDHPIRPDHEAPRAVKDLRHVDPASVFEKRKQTRKLEP